MNGLDIAESIAERLEHARATSTSTNFANGAAGDALFFFALAQARSSERWAHAAHQSIKRAATTEEATYSGLFVGLSGLLFVTSYMARVDARYTNLRDQCAKTLVASGATAPPLRAAERAKEYDLVSGVAGVHAALLYAGCTNEARGTRAYLEWLLADKDRWSCLHDLSVDAGRAHDLGVAHGLAGMISVLAADEEAGTETLERLAEFLWEMRVPGTLQWPSSVGTFASEPTRAAWCYGNPGVATALLRVAQRTQSETIAERARAALLEVVDAPRESWGQVDYALCHGGAGNGLILEIAAQALADERIGACAREVTAELTLAFDEASPLGYRNWDNLGRCWIDDPALMTGAAGIGLTLVTLWSDVDSSWTTAFALPEPVRKATGTAR